MDFINKNNLKKMNFKINKELINKIEFQMNIQY